MFGVWAGVYPDFEAVSRRAALLGPLGDCPTNLSGGEARQGLGIMLWVCGSSGVSATMSGESALNPATTHRRSKPQSAGFIGLV